MTNIYQPQEVKVKKIEALSDDVCLLRLVKSKGRFNKNEQGLTFLPGQFMMAGLLGHGEAPFGAASSPYQQAYLDLIIRKVGVLTKALHQLKPGDKMQLRGPYGNGWPLDFMKGKDILMVTGGCGIPPIAALIEYIIKNRKDFQSVYLVYGARSPQDLLMRSEFKRWAKNIQLVLTVDQADKSWKGKVGMVSDLIDDIEINPHNTVAAMCGPGPMMEALEEIFRPMGISNRQLFVNMERKMQCGVGKCQHCSCGDKLVCQDGPVFNFDEVDKNWD